MRDAERLAILHEVDRGMIREESPAAIAEAEVDKGAKFSFTLPAPSSPL